MYSKCIEMINERFLAVKGERNFDRKILSEDKSVLPPILNVQNSISAAVNKDVQPNWGVWGNFFRINV